jgi:flagellar biosynthesis/type III secretory pathway M-ring protein FliF/YscJ
LNTFKIIISIAVNSGIISSIVLWFLKRYINKKLTIAEAEAAERQKVKQKRMMLDSELHHAQGRVLFWIHHAIIHNGEHNGELQDSFEHLQEVEDKEKELDREILSRFDND